MSTRNFWNELVERALSEDQCQWDWTTRGSVAKPDRIVRAKVIAKSEGVWAATDLARALDPAIRAISKLRDGDRLKLGQTVIEWAGPAHLVLAYERAYLNVASYAGGIATATRRLVDIVREELPKRTPRVSCTRKILPAYRDLAIHSVLAGGGHPHRVSLAGGVLIKENHVAAAGGIRKAIDGARAAAPHGLKIEVEVRDLKELRAATGAGADGVLLDNFTPDEVRSALGIVHGLGIKPVVEVSGGIDERTIAAYAQPGVDVISVGAITHSVQSLDLSLLVAAR
jgi:nicotinate-nucleotide pyrophosphorylase (carboxylating)